VKLTVVAAALAAALSACDDGAVIEVPAGFPAPPIPADNALTAARADLGRRLFYDKQLSRTQEIACASCHLPAHAFADPRRFSVGVEGRLGGRNAPSIVNLVYNTSFFWDGGAHTLEQQVIGPIINPLEMDMQLGAVVARLARDPSYLRDFQQAYGTDPAPGSLTKAIASFMRTIVSGDSPFDRYQRGDRSALDESQRRGMEIALGERGECFHCHVGFNFTNNDFRNNSLYARYEDVGRAKVTESADDVGKFKVPSLRNVALTAPYMHDGSLATLEDVVEHYSKGGSMNENADPNIRPLDLTAREKADLVAFLRALTDESLATNPRYAAPVRPANSGLRY
jgi:cytochrome c peroxidase